MKITSDMCKDAVVAYCAANKSVIDAQFGSPITAQEFSAALDKRNWKRLSKRASPDNFLVDERVFDCRPFEDQLRAYVYTDIVTQKIIRILILGE